MYENQIMKKRVLLEAIRMSNIKILSEKVFLHNDDCYNYAHDLVNRYKMSDGDVALDDDDFDFVLSNSDVVKMMELEYSGDEISQDDYKDSFNKYNVKKAKNILIFIYGDPRLVNVNSTVECTNTLVEITEGANIIYGAKMDSKVDKNVRVVLVCGS